MSGERQEPELVQPAFAKALSVPVDQSDDESQIGFKDSGRNVLLGALIVMGLAAVGGGWFAWSTHSDNHQQRVAVEQRLKELSDDSVRLDREKSLIQTSIQAMELRNQQQQAEFTEQLAAKDAEAQTVTDRYAALQQQKAAAVADAEALYEQAKQQHSELEQLREQLQGLIENTQSR